MGSCVTRDPAVVARNKKENASNKKTDTTATNS